MPETDALRLRFDLYDLDERQARLLRSGRPIALPPKAFAVLCALARQPGQLVTKTALLDAVWGHQYVSDSVLKGTISELRAALGDDARQPRYIGTAARRGYRFIGMPQSGADAAEPNAAAPAGVAARPPLAAEGAARLLPAPLVGRDAASARLHAAWADARAGRRRIVWLAGEAGIGKTTLIEHFVAEAGATVAAHGQCVEQHGAGEPYLPVLEALAELCRNDAALVPLLRTVAPTWLLQLPWLSEQADRDALRRELTGIGQERMLRELGELLDRYTEHKPLLLVTEDLHWSDDATVRLIDHVARRRGPARLMWLASFRLAELIAEEHPLKALRHELRLHRLADEIVLEPLSERDVADYIERRFPARPVTEGLVRTLHARTEGLPLFVVNVIDEMMSQGMPEADAAGPQAGVAGQVPESLVGVIDKQIARLAPEQRALLEAASVCGVEFGAATLADVMARDAPWVGERCDELARRQQFLGDAGLDPQSDGSIDARYAFRHALYRQVFYRRIGALPRAQLHRRAAASMERSRAAGAGVTAAELASHHERGHDLPAALRCYAEAAEHALRSFAPIDALNLTAHALALLPRCAEGSQRDELEWALLGPRTVAASRVLGVTAPETRVAYERVQALVERLPAQASRGLETGLGWMYFVRGDYDRALELAARLEALADQRGDRVLHVAACHLTGATMSYQGRLVEGRQRLEQGLAAGAELGERLANALSVVDLDVSMRLRLGQVLMHLGFADRARVQIDAARSRADALGQPYAQRLVLIFDSFVQMRLGRPERVLASADALQRIATEHSIAQAEGPARWLRGWAIAKLGDPMAGHASIREGYAFDTKIGMQRGRSGVLGYAAEALILAGRWRDAQAELHQAQVLAERMGERIYAPDLALLHARIAHGLGDLRSARAAMLASAREAGEQQAAWLELNARVALCELAGASTEDVDALRTSRKRVAEGLDATLVQGADALLHAAGL